MISERYIAECKKDMEGMNIKPATKNHTDWKGERQQKLKRGFATKKEAQAWEREFLMQKQADVNMTFESFAQLYEKDMKLKLKLNTWLTKESIIQKKILPYFGKRKLSEITAKDGHFSFFPVIIYFFAHISLILTVF